MAIKDDMQDVQEAVINELITENGITNTLADGQVTETKILNNAVTTNKIANGAVTAAKLGGDVDLGQVNDGAVTTAKIADDAVTPAKLDRAYLESSGDTILQSGNKLQLNRADNSRNMKLFTDNNAGTIQTSFDPIKIDGQGYIRFDIAASEKMRIETAENGQVLFGKTTNSIGTAGTAISSSLGVRAAVSNNIGLLLNRLNSNGEIINLRRDNTTVGSINASSNNIAIFAHGVNNTGWAFLNNSAVTPMKNGVLADNLVDLGSSSHRMDDINATNGTIQTSDANEKQDIEALSEAEQRVAVACKGLLRKFRWKSAVEEKGDEARIHFGIIAQDLQAAFEAEGLDAGRYAMFISSTWTDEETGEEKTRLGVRYSELLAFIISAI